MNVLITGGASGLGESITKRVAQDPTSKVYFTYNNSKVNAEKIEKEFPNAISVKCDFRNSGEVEALKSKMTELNPDVLINSAYHGNPIKSYFHKIPPTDFITEFNENIIPTVIITQAALSVFRKRKSGKVITILTSFLLNRPPIGSAVYVSNKAYLKELSRVWATENSIFNITSNTVSPSFLETNFSPDVDERVLEQIKEGHPLKKLLTTEEVAETVFFLVNASTHTNGIDIVMNAAVNIS